MALSMRLMPRSSASRATASYRLSSVSSHSPRYVPRPRAEARSIRSSGRWNSSPRRFACRSAWRKVPLAVARPTSSEAVAVAVAGVFTLLTLRDAGMRARVCDSTGCHDGARWVVFYIRGSFGHDACLSYESGPGLAYRDRAVPVTVAAIATRRSSTYVGFCQLGIALVDTGALHHHRGTSHECLRDAVPAPHADASRRAVSRARRGADAPLAVDVHGHCDEGMGGVPSQASRFRRP